MIGRQCVLGGIRRRCHQDLPSPRLPAIVFSYNDLLPLAMKLAILAFTAVLPAFVFGSAFRVPHQAGARHEPTSGLEERDEEGLTVHERANYIGQICTNRSVTHKSHYSPGILAFPLLCPIKARASNMASPEQQGNRIGTCQTTDYCRKQLGYADPLPDCPGPANIQCCVDDNCINGAKGGCQDTQTMTCDYAGPYGYYAYDALVAPCHPPTKIPPYHYEAPKLLISPT